MKTLCQAIFHRKPWTLGGTKESKWWSGGKGEKDGNREEPIGGRRPNSGVGFGGFRMMRAKKAKEGGELIDFQLMEITPRRR